MTGPTAPVVLVVAMAENGVIGNRGSLPWHSAEDRRRFKAITLGTPCIMGRKTWESLPRKPLPGRTNIVLSRTPGCDFAGAKSADRFERAVEIAAAEHPAEIAVIGGEAIFAAALGLARKIYLTEIEGSPEGDAFMPAFDRAEWRETVREGPNQSGGHRYWFVTLERKTTPASNATIRR